jgi:hypothetical protein
LFGGTGETSDKGPYGKQDYNILSRVLGETFISSVEAKGIKNYTQNAVSEKDNMTGQALMTILTVPKETVFIGTVTLKDPTKEMTSIIVDNINRLTRIGARSVEWGKVETTITGGTLSDREDISVYNLLQNPPRGTTPEDIAPILRTLPQVQTAYTTLYSQTGQVLKELIKRRSKSTSEKVIDESGDE